MKILNSVRSKIQIPDKGKVIYFKSARYEEALSLLQRLSYYADQMQRNYIIIEVNMLMAITLSRMGRGRVEEKDFDAVKKLVNIILQEYFLLKVLQYLNY